LSSGQSLANYGAASTLWPLRHVFSHFSSLAITGSRYPLNRINISLKIIINQVFQSLIADLTRLARSADDSNTSWLEEEIIVAGIGAHGFASVYLKKTVASGGRVNVIE
jgi:hypothetical protein